MKAFNGIYERFSSKDTNCDYSMSGNAMDCIRAELFPVTGEYVTGIIINPCSCKFLMKPFHKTAYV